MALTAHDLKQIKLNVTDVVEPRFDETNQRIDHANKQMESRFGQLRHDIDNLSAATNRKFHAVFTDVAVMREDLHAVKQLVNDHGFRIARLEQDSDIE